MIVSGRPYPDICAASEQIPLASEAKQLVIDNRQSRDGGHGDVMTEAVDGSHVPPGAERAGEYAC